MLIRSQERTQFPHRRSIASVLLLSQLGQRSGLSLQHCLAGTGLLTQDLLDMKKEVDADQELQLIENLVDHCSDAFVLGMEAGLDYHLTSYGIWGYALISSPTLRSAIDMGLRYLGLTYAFTNIEMREKGNDMVLSLCANNLPKKLKDFLIARDILAIYTIHRELFIVPITVRSVHLTLDSLAAKDQLEQLLNTEVYLSQAENSIRFDSAMLDRPLPQANPVTVQLCEQQCQVLLRARFNSESIAGKVREHLLTMQGRKPSMDEVALQLQINVRTLRRHLVAENTSWRHLIDDVNSVLAEELLAIESLTIEEVAERVGYSEVSNFTHAFKRWKGVSPSRFRVENSTKS